MYSRYLVWRSLHNKKCSQYVRRGGIVKISCVGHLHANRIGWWLNFCGNGGPPWQGFDSLSSAEDCSCPPPENGRILRTVDEIGEVRPKTSAGETALPPNTARH